MLCYRLNLRPGRALPLNVRSAGHYQLAPNERNPREPGEFLQVFWSVSGSGSFKVGRSFVPVQGDMIFYYVAGEPHDLVAGPEGWDYRWLTFDGIRYPRITRDYGLVRAQAAGPCPSGLFERLYETLRDPTPEGELRASALGYEILLRAGDPPRGTSASGGRDIAEVSRAWIDAHFTDARLNVAGLAEKLGLHRASLHRMFTRRHGVPPVQYLGRLRLRLALELLTTTTLPVADVAVRCGLPDVAHFSKLVSRHTGFSPRVYRQRHGPRVPTV
ncbi:helix-turn-helix domain-containing protein [Rariglobus hedericola]|uniref:AraC family transcriptional regulator n=1 Tax=Rariglobus hedericola TaxID=2597822 RepID=A0A556QIU2_9BACT|nr:AraC family transcriptional regulator [Rariglobus hedericola]TSJ76564.1 AraC family transcriptional regulator [Rariglobus hedericola]